MNIGEAVRERILELCEQRNISINKLCHMSGVTQSTVNNIISGRNNSATVSTIQKLCDQGDHGIPSGAGLDGIPACRMRRFAPVHYFFVVSQKYGAYHPFTGKDL